MTSTGKFVVGLIVVVFIIATGAFYWFNRTSPTQPAGTQTGSTSMQTSQSGNTLTTSPSDTSDAAMSQDEASIDSQMSGLQSDNTDVTNSLNAQ